MKKPVKYFYLEKNELKKGTKELNSPKPHEVTIKVEAISLNFRDLIVQKNLGGDTADGLIPLSDAAGVVIAVGDSVTKWKAGDRVSPSFFSLWNKGAFKTEYLNSALGGTQTPGVLTDHLNAHEDSLVAIPDSLTFVEAATLPCAGVTAWHALFERGKLKKDETVLIQGTGGVAMFALQLAVAVGAKVILTSSSEEKLIQAKELGAWKVINYKKNSTWDEEVRLLTDGIGVDHVLELGGPDTYQRSINSLAAAGKIYQIGVLTGFGSTPNLLPLQFINGTIHGICVGSVEHYSNLVEFIKTHNLKPIIQKTFQFDEVHEAYSYLESAKHFGKIVIEVK